MKKATITVNFDEEKVAALKLYLEQKGTSVETELAKSLDTLFAKSVPAGVREFIALRSGNGKRKQREGLLKRQMDIRSLCRKKGKITNNDGSTRGI